MSFALNIPMFTPADYEDNDTYGEDCTIEMTNRQDTIASIGTPIVTRTDGNPITAGDMSVSNVTVISGGLKFAWKGSGGIANSGYYIKFPLTLTSENVIYRTVLVLVPEYVG